ncbi:MAG TPA: hypothetical protein VD993_01715 [Chitinophagaceae bacterium]|nr:hypothetical protein [Chitinophagaceae bacterium]
MSLLLNAISVASAFLFGVGVVYLLLDFTLGRLRFLHSDFEWHGLQVKDFAFLAIAASAVLKFTNIIRPF